DLRPGLRGRMGRLLGGPGRGDGDVSGPLRPLRAPGHGHVHLGAARGRHRDERARLVAGQGGRLHARARDGDGHADRDRDAPLLGRHPRPGPGLQDGEPGHSRDARRRRADARRALRHPALPRRRAGQRLAADERPRAAGRGLRGRGDGPPRVGERTVKRRAFVKAAGAGAVGAAWLGRGTARAATQAGTSPAAGKTYDVAVVGAGCFGAWTAYHLRNAGKTVVILDKYGAANARASSGGESRVIRAGYGKDELYTRFAQRSLGIWKSVFERVRQPALYRETGVLWMAAE